MTKRQVEAYRYVYLHGCSHDEAAGLMQCSRSNVTHLLQRLKKRYPRAFPAETGPKRIIRLTNGMEKDIEQKF